MEINAKVHAAADDLKLLEQVHKALTDAEIRNGRRVMKSAEVNGVTLH